MPAREPDEVVEEVAPSAQSALPAGTTSCPSLSGRIYQRQYRQLMSTRDKHPEVIAVETRWQSTVTHDDGHCVRLNHSFYVRELYGQVYFNHHIRLNNGEVLYKKIALYLHHELMDDTASPLPIPRSPQYTDCIYEARELANCAHSTVPSSATLFLYYNFPDRPSPSRGLRPMAAHFRRQRSPTARALPPLPSRQGQRAQRQQQQQQRSIRRSRRRANSDDFLADVEGAAMRVLIHSYLNQTNSIIANVRKKTIARSA